MKIMNLFMALDELVELEPDEICQDPCTEVHPDHDHRGYTGNEPNAGRGCCHPVLIVGFVIFVALARPYFGRFYTAITSKQLPCWCFDPFTIDRLYARIPIHTGPQNTGT